MPRYFFHVTDGTSFPDLQGSEFVNLEAARIEAVRFSGELLKDAASHFWAGEEWSMRVTDARDLTLFTLTFIATNAPSTEPYQASP